jgi:phosphoribosylformimino-5-aminoimidazole carboxamide ribotide isomerase
VIIYPAIDIRGGKCVRLVEGDFDRETVFDQDPAEAARRWEAGGATHIHVVDLDGARNGEPTSLDTISRIRSAVGAKIQVGGGIRSVDNARALVDLGVDRVILGSAIVSNPDAVRDIAGALPGRIAAGLDARDGRLATNGWLAQSDVPAIDAARHLIQLGISTIIYTDIRRDGTLSGPNLDALTEMIAIEGAEIIASGGIGTIDDVRAVAEGGAAGVIIGRALYDGRVDLVEAMAWQTQQQAPLSPSESSPAWT